MIRKAQKKDIDNIYDICIQYDDNFKNTYLLDTEIDKDYSIMLVDEDDGIIRAFLYAQDFIDNIDLLFLIVDNKQRKKGIASNLMKYFVDNYVVNNKTITLEVAKNNFNAIKLYEKYGFKTINVRKKYYKDIDALVMRR
jgi:ribosomal-protein-alanine N-acetyltransferase